MQGSPYDDMQFKMARNHIDLFSAVAGETFMAIYDHVRPFTMLSIERLYDLYLSVRYVDQAEIAGCVLEVGVWKGGALGTAILSNISSERRVVGFDTFEGHFIPPKDEIDIRGHNMRERWIELQTQGQTWASANYEDCLEFLESLEGAANIELVKGDAKETLEHWDPEPISILRIDCDWYAESRVALEILWPHLARGGVAIFDDYGHLDGQRRAVDEYFSTRPVKFTHVDSSCLSIVKTPTS